MTTKTVSNVTKNVDVRLDGTESSVTITVDPRFGFTTHDIEADPRWQLNGTTFNTRHLVVGCSYVVPVNVVVKGNTLTTYYRGFKDPGGHSSAQAEATYQEDIAGAGIRLYTSVTAILAAN